MTRLDRLTLEYCRVSNILKDYRRSAGFTPNARVRAQFQNETPKLGVIAPYGDHWATVDSISVPVILDDGYCQPWMMQHLTVLE